MIALGLIWLCLWRQKWRLLGLPAMAAGVAIAAPATQPLAMIEETGSAVAVRGSDGRYGVLGGGASFEIETWLRADADPRGVSAATFDEDLHCDPLGCATTIADSGLYLALALEPAALAEDCRIAAIVVTPHVAPEGCDAMIVIDRSRLMRGHAHAIYAKEAPAGELAFHVVATRPDTRRPWMPPLADQ